MTGRGFGFGTFASSQVGVVADVEVNKKTGKIVAKHAVHRPEQRDHGQPAAASRNQMSGALIQGLSRALYEQATFTKERITSLDWVTYPILRFKDAPKVTLVNVHPGKYTISRSRATTTPTCRRATRPRSTTAGRSPARASRRRPAIGSAVANAFFDATGVRIRQAPMNPATVRATLKAAGM